jgi:hypothetical protein
MPRSRLSGDESLTQDCETREALGLGWDAATKADLLRSLDRDAEDNRRMSERYHKVADAQASEAAGGKIATDPTSADGRKSDVQVRVNSDDVTQASPPPPTPIVIQQPVFPPVPAATPAWAKVLMTAIVVAGAIAVASFFAPIGNAPTTPPDLPTPPVVVPPVTTRDNLEITVTHAPQPAPATQTAK